jgi:hypothetical protein
LSIVERAHRELAFPGVIHGPLPGFGMGDMVGLARLHGARLTVEEELP